MIIFDTNVLFGAQPGRPQKFDLLWALKQSGQQHVSIPWMVQEELVAQRVLTRAKAHDAAVSATRNLNRLAPWLSERGPKPYSLAELRLEAGIRSLGCRSSGGKPAESMGAGTPMSP